MILAEGKRGPGVCVLEPSLVFNPLCAEAPGSVLHCAQWTEETLGERMSMTTNRYSSGFFLHRG